MKFDKYEWSAISIMVSLFILVGFIQGWSVSLVILNMCIISAIMTMGAVSYTHLTLPTKRIV